MSETREVIRCPFCNLNQFMTLSGLCRKPECGKPLKIVLSETSKVALAEFYRPEKPFRFHDRETALMAKQIIPAFDAGRIIQDIVSNVRPRKKKQPRYGREYLSVPGFPTELRLRCLRYIEKHGMSLREMVIKAIESQLDRE